MPYLGEVSALVTAAFWSCSGSGMAFIEGPINGFVATLVRILASLVRVFYRERLSWKAIGGAFLAVGGVAILFLR